MKYPKSKIWRVHQIKDTFRILGFSFKSLDFVRPLIRYTWACRVNMGNEQGTIGSKDNRRWLVGGGDQGKGFVGIPVIRVGCGEFGQRLKLRRGFPTLSNVLERFLYCFLLLG